MFVKVDAPATLWHHAGSPGMRWMLRDIDKACSTQLWNEIRPLYYTVYLGNFEVTGLLIREGANINLGARYIDNHPKFSSPLLHSPAYWERR
jgi:hypothetical protein